MHAWYPAMSESRYSLSKTGPKLPSRRRFAALEWCCIATKASVDDVRLTKMIWYMLANLHRYAAA